MTHSPDTALATEIGTQVGSLTLGTNLFIGTVRADDTVFPRNCVFVWSGGGPIPQRTMGEPDEIRTTIVHVRVRDAKYSVGSTLATLIMNSLRAVSVATYLDMKGAIGEPRAMGQDPDGNHYFGMEYIMIYESD